MGARSKITQPIILSTYPLPTSIIVYISFLCLPIYLLIHLFIHPSLQLRIYLFIFLYVVFFCSPLPQSSIQSVLHNLYMSGLVFILSPLRSPSLRGVLYSRLCTFLKVSISLTYSLGLLLPHPDPSCRATRLIAEPRTRLNPFPATWLRRTATLLFASSLVGFTAFKRETTNRTPPQPTSAPASLRISVPSSLGVQMVTICCTFCVYPSMHVRWFRALSNWFTNLEARQAIWSGLKSQRCLKDHKSKINTGCS